MVKVRRLLNRHLSSMTVTHLAFPLAVLSLIVASYWRYLHLPNRVVTSRAAKPLTNSSGFPTTRFTAHVKELTENYDYAGMDDNCECDGKFQFKVSTKRSAPRVECLSRNGAPLDPKTANQVSLWWCAVVKNIFQDQKRVLPYNVSFMVSAGDRWFPDRPGFCCLGSSSKGGIHSITNFLEIKRMTMNKTYPITPWHNRSRVPIWRGTPWLNTGAYVVVDWDSENYYEQVLLSSPRLRAVDWSMHHPSLLEARVHTKNAMKNDPHWFPNSTYALDKLLTLNRIPEDAYYTKYQVAVVMCGIGAAFRTSIHFSTSTAVVLHDCYFQEWFTPLLKPFEHYIPLSKHLSDVDEKMRWIQENPEKVKKIAENGRQFYLDYLDFERNEEHIYEFLYRLAETKEQQDNNTTSVS
jgi:hypothetical protein